VTEVSKSSLSCVRNSELTQSRLFREGFGKTKYFPASEQEDNIATSQFFEELSPNIKS
jgi:hypothetical protein